MAGVLSWRNDRLGLARVTSKTANDEQKLEEGYSRASRIASVSI